MEDDNHKIESPNVSEERKQQTARIAETEEPVMPRRVRKSVERSVELKTIRKFRVHKGRGTALKDIPNVANQLKKQKADETFKLLHFILFGRHMKAFKSNLSEFSGFACHENQVKHRSKIKEKLVKYVVGKLLEICDVLDIHVSKRTRIRKDEIVAGLLNFLAAPRVTTDVVAAENEQLSSAIKRKRGSDSIIPLPASSGSTTAKRSAKGFKCPQNEASELPAFTDMVGRYYSDGSSADKSGMAEKGKPSATSAVVKKSGNANSGNGSASNHSVLQKADENGAEILVELWRNSENASKTVKASPASSSFTKVTSAKGKALVEHLVAAVAEFDSNSVDAIELTRLRVENGALECRVDGLTAEVTRLRAVVDHSEQTFKQRVEEEVQKYLEHMVDPPEVLSPVGVDYSRQLNFLPAKFC